MRKKDLGLRVVTIPEGCTRDEFILCAKTALKTMTPRGVALILLDDETIKYGDCDRDETHEYRYFSDRWSPEEITHGQLAQLIAVEYPTHFSKESIREVLHGFEDLNNGILLAQERTVK